MSAVTKINPHLSTIQAPDLIASKPIWLMWRFEHAEGEVKPRKVPYYANGQRRYGVQGRAEDRNQLVTLEAARSAAARRSMDGIGLATLDGEFSVLDFDKCTTNGKLNPEVEKFAIGTYAEYSPSGEGVHIFVLGNVAGNQKSHANATQYGVEGFATKGFVTYTGNALEITDLTDSQNTIAEPAPALTALLRARFGTASEELDSSDKLPLNLKPEVLREALDVLDPSTDHNTWLSIGMALHHETGGQAFNMWDEWSSHSSKYPGTEALQLRWDSFGKGGGKTITARTLIQLANQNGAHITINAVSTEEFENLDAQVAKIEDTTANKMRFHCIPAADFAVTATWSYIIKGLLPKAALAVLFGESGSGKSFVALDMAFAIAQGAPWRDMRTTQGRIVYLVAEGAMGFRNRLIALSQHSGINLHDVPLDIIDAAPNLLQKEDAVDVAKSILASGPKPSLVIVDTFAQVLAGANENASEDMGKALAHCRGIHKATGALVLLVHHSGKDSSKGARGWSGLRAAADAELEVVRTPMGRYIRTTKQKDGADFKEWGFALEPVTIGEDTDGDPITTCVCTPADMPTLGDTKVRGINEQALVNVLTEIGLGQTAGIERTAVLALALQSFGELSKDEVRSRKSNLARAFNKMADAEDFFILEDDGTVTLI